MLDEALGNLGEGAGLESDAAATADQLALPPGPATLLAASVQLPWQAALAACLQLLGRCLDRALASVRAREGAPLALPLGDSLAAGQLGGEAAAAVAAAAELLCGVVGEAQRGAAAIAAARIMQRGSGTNTLTMAKKGGVPGRTHAAGCWMPGNLSSVLMGGQRTWLQRKRHSPPLQLQCSTRPAPHTLCPLHVCLTGACSHPVGGALLHFATQLLDVTQQRTSGRTAPVLLSAYTAVLARLLPLGQQEGLLQQAKAAGEPIYYCPPLR